MRTDPSAWTFHEVRRHKVALSAACILSLAAHVMLLLWMPGITVRQPAGEPPKEHQKSVFRLADVKAAPKPDVTRQVLGADPARTAGAMPGVTELRRPLDPARTQPEPATGVSGLGYTKPLAETTELPRPNFWQPRQEIVAIERRVVPDDAARLPRRPLPPVERVPKAEDVVSPFDRGVPAGMLKGTGLDLSMTAPRTGAGLEAVPVRGGRTGVERLREGSEPGADALLKEKPGQITKVKPIENFLTLGVSVCKPASDPKYTYFRMDVRRIGADVLPVMPKDILLVVDNSASMTEQKLYFCRNGLLACLDTIRPPDRFNVMAFSDGGRYCFESWTEPDAEHMAVARGFVQGLRAEGNTDVFASIRDLPARAADSPGRTVVALLVTDGRPTTGVMNSSDIISEFSRLNDGRVSVFTFGTAQTANAYLLDLMGYCNRGEGFVLRSGRWDIPGAMANWLKQTARPVLTDVRFTLQSGSPCEIFPVQTANLYLDRGLVMYGRCPRSWDRVLFRATGRGRDNECDMVYDLSLAASGKPGGSDIRDTWARQKVYHLIGRYARGKDHAILRDIQSTARDYGVDIPHKGEF